MININLNSFSAMVSSLIIKAFTVFLKALWYLYRKKNKHRSFFTQEDYSCRGFFSKTFLWEL